MVLTYHKLNVIRRLHVLRILVHVHYKFKHKECKDNYNHVMQVIFLYIPARYNNIH